MRFRWRNETVGGHVLEIECDRSDELAYVDAERVQRGDLSAFLPFSCSRGAKAYEILYGVGTCVALKNVLEAPLSPDMLRAILGSVLQVMQQCEENGLSRLRVVFDPEYVFFDYGANMVRFVYVPMRTYVSPSGIETLLECVCRKARVAPNDSPFVFAAWDFACRTTVLTSVGFQEFLKSWGMQVPNRTLRRRQEARPTSFEDSRSDFGWNFVSDALNERVMQEQQSARAEQEQPAVRVTQEQPIAHVQQEQPAMRAEQEQPVGQSAAEQQVGLEPATAGHAIDKREQTDSTPLYPGQSSTAALGSAVGRSCDKPLPKVTRTSTGDCFALPDGDYLIGRAPECAICLDGIMGASRRHARLVVRNGLCSICDMNSTNGVWVNGERLISDKLHALSDGDCFIIGDEEFELR